MVCKLSPACVRILVLAVPVGAELIYGGPSVTRPGPMGVRRTRAEHELINNDTTQASLFVS